MRESIKRKVEAFTKRPSLPDDAILKDIVPESFALVELVIELQEEFGVRLSQEDLKDVRTVGDLVAVVEAKK